MQNEKLQARLEKIESAYDEQRKDAETKRLDRARATLVDNIKNFVDNDEQYALVKHRGAYDLVAEVMQQHYIKSKEIMEYSDAARIVEDHYEQEAEHYFGAQKLQERWKAKLAPAEQEASQEAAAPANNGGPKTLSNKNSAQIFEAHGANSEWELTGCNYTRRRQWLLVYFQQQRQAQETAAKRWLPKL